MKFITKIDDIDALVATIDPKLYAKTRNFGNGAVTKLSPYISRGVISTRYVCMHILSLEKPWYEIEKLIQELAWRDYWQQIWITKGDAIYCDLKNEQSPISNYQIPKTIANGTTTIEAIDTAIKELYTTGYMHNHMRMYVAAICCNVAKSHWLQPAKWLYANLLDGDIASNHLSWQWIAGAFSNKKYFANQDNINHFFDSKQKGTFLDVDYDRFEKMEIPKVLLDTISLNINTNLDQIELSNDIKNVPSLIYNYYNLDPLWHKDKDYQRILLLEPSKFKQHPVSSKCINFALRLSENIPHIKVFVGEFEALLTHINPDKMIYKEHPLNFNYIGREESRDWMFAVKGYFPSFFSFWKKCKKELKQ